MRNGSPSYDFLIPHSSFNGKLMAEEKNKTKTTSSIGRGKILAGLLTVLTSAGIGGYHYFQSEESPPPSKLEIVKEPEPAQGIGFIDLTTVKNSLDKEGRLAELSSIETRLKLELKDALKPMLMSPPKVEQKPFDDSVWQKNAQAVISERAEIEKRKKQIAKKYKEDTEAEYLKRRDDANNKFLNEVLNIKLKLQNADNMRLTSAEISEMEKRLEEIKIERNQIQKKLMDEWTQEIFAYAEEAVKADDEKLSALAEEAKAKITEEAKQAQAAAIERNKNLMEKAMQESKTRQDRRQKLMTELQSITKERSELEGKMMDNIGDLAAKLAVIHKLKLVLAVKGVRLNIESPYLESLSPSLDVDVLSTKEPLIITSTNAVDLTDELIKELQEQ